MTRTAGFFYTAQDEALETAVDEAIEVIDYCLSKLKKTQTLFVGFGETHNNQDHPLAQRLILSGLHERKIPVAFGYEWISPSRSYAPLSPLYRQSLINSFEDIPWFLNPDLRRELIASCFDRKISVEFNDQANVEMSYEESKSVNGMQKRNQIMALNSMAHARASGARVYFYMAGLYHLVGGRYLGEERELMYPHSESMDGYLSRHGQKTLSIIPTCTYYDEKNYPADLPKDHLIHRFHVPEPSRT